MSPPKIITNRKNIFLRIVRGGVFFVFVMVILTLLFPQKSEGSFTEKINYQGKLTDASNGIVPDGLYDVEFRLYTTGGGGSAAWTESWTSSSLFTSSGTTFTNDGCGSGIDRMSYTTDTNENTLAAGQYLWNTTKKEPAVIESVNTSGSGGYICYYNTFNNWVSGETITNRIYVKSGLFSVMLGSVQNLSTVDFNQPIYLGVTVGTDPEMVPRKVIGAVPAAFEAKELGGYDWESPGAIGSSAPNSAVFTTLDSSGNVNIGSSSGSTIAIGNTTGTATMSSGGASSWTNTSGDLTFSTALSGTLTFTSAGALNLSAASPSAWVLPSAPNALNFGNGALSIDTLNNRIGIGTTDPQSGIHLHNIGNSIQITNSVTGGSVWNDGIRMALVDDKDLSLEAHENEGNITLSAGLGGDITFGTANGQNMIITEAYASFEDRIGIGLTSPAAFLEIRASTNAAAQLRLQTGIAPSTPADGDMWYDGSHLYFHSTSDQDLLAGGHTQNTDTGTSSSSFTLANASDASATNVILQFGNTNAETLTFQGASTDNFILSDDLDMNGSTIINIGNSGTDFDTSGGLTLASTLTVSNLGIEFTESDTNPSCSTGNYSIFADTSDGKLKKCTNGVVSDLDTLSPGAPNANTFIDNTAAAWTGANDTTEIFNDTTKPNITTDASDSKVLVAVQIHGTASNTNSDAFIAARIVRTTDGSDPSCSSATNVGVPMIGGFTTATTQPWQVVGTFIDSPGVTGNIKYTVCSSAESTTTATDTPEQVIVSLVAFGSNTGEVDWASPGQIGSSAPNTAVFTTLSSSGNVNIGSSAGSTVALGNTTGAATFSSGGTSSWTNTSGNLTISTSTSGTLALTSVGALNLTAGANSIWTLPGNVNALNIDSNTLSIDALNDRIGIGRTSPAAFLEITASTATVPHMRLVAGANVGSPSSGDLWFDGTHLYFYNGGLHDIIAGGHTQNTDTGTSSATFTLANASDASTTNITLQFGSINAKTLIYQGASTDNFALNDDLDITGGLTTTTSINIGTSLAVGTISTFGSSTAYDPISISPVARGTNSYTGTITSADLTGTRTWTLQDNTGIIPLGTAGNTLFFTTSGNTTLTLPTSGTVATGTGQISYNAYWSGTNTLASEQYVSVTRGGTGTGTTFTQGAIVFAGAGGTYNQDAAYLFWDAGTHHLGIGTSSVASYSLNVNGSANVTSLYLNGVQTFGVGSGTTSGQTLVWNSGTSAWQYSNTIFNNGTNVGIGTTNPLFGLQVTGTLGVGGTAYFGSNVGIGDSSPANLFVVGNGDLFQVDSSGNLTIQNQADLRLGDADGSNYIAIQAPANVSQDRIYTWPSAYPVGDGYTLTSAIDGTLNWAAPGAATIGMGSAISGSIDGSVLFVNSSNQLAQDPSNFFWNNSTKRLGIGTSTPASLMQITGAGTVDLVNILNTGVGQTAATSGVDGLQVDFANGGTTAIDNAGVRINVTSNNSTASTTLEGVYVASITAQANSTESAIRVGANWDNVMRIDSTSAVFDINNASNSTFSIVNNGTGVASVSIETGGSYTGAGAVTLSSGASSALTLNSASNTLTIDSTDTTLSATGLTAMNVAAGFILSSSSGDISLQPANNSTSARVNIGDQSTTDTDILVLDYGTADPTGTQVNGAMYYNSSTNKFRCYEGSAWKDCITSPPDTSTFTDSTSVAWTDSDTTQLFNDATKPNITTDSTAATVLVTVQIHGTASNTNNDATLAARLVRTTNGSDPQCSSVTNVGVPMISAFTTNNTTPWQVTGTFIDSPGVAGTIKYTVCTSAESDGTATDTPEQVIVNLVELGADLAEKYYTNDDSIQSGDVVAIDSSLPAGVKKSAKSYDSNVIGVVSTVPGITLDDAIGMGLGRAVPVALAGRIPVKVSAENGKVKAGDYLTASSVPGVAMKATKAGPIIGQAIQDFSYPDNQTGLVMTFVKNAYYNGEGIEDIADENGDSIITLQRLVNTKANTNSLNVSEITTDRVAAGLEVITPKVTTQELAVDKIRSSLTPDVSVTLSEDGKLLVGDGSSEPQIIMDAEGNATFSGVVTAKSVRAESIEGLEFIQKNIFEAKSSADENADQVKNLGSEIKYLKDTLSSLSDNTSGLSADTMKELEMKNALVFEKDVKFKGKTFFKAVAEFLDKVIFRKDVEFEGKVQFAKDSAGYAIIKEDEKEVTVEFETEYADPPIVSANLTSEKVDDKDLQEATDEFALVSDVKFIVTDVTTKGFKIRLATDAIADTYFTWQAISVKDPKTYGEKSGDKDKKDGKNISGGSDSQPGLVNQSTGVAPTHPQVITTSPDFATAGLDTQAVSNSVNVIKENIEGVVKGAWTVRE